MATPFRQVRASYDDETITVYQAYNRKIANAAVAGQKLNASPEFRTTRMTWIKPSWAWMLYRAGYSYKDPGQERILALKMKHKDFISLLERAVLTTHAPPSTSTTEADTSEKPTDVKVQWDPERDVRLERLNYRSIQIGIPAAISKEWVDSMIVSIEDVTEKARALKKILDERSGITDDELSSLGLVPEERPFELPEQLQTSLRMNIVS
ncbi:hypothetical protein GQ53DRAFT_656916 [Thozetella sp. PMI_491]|nr:hypothetical protein GQ53DRAFT_656916 [Thozetella sp. PMI_491]